MEVELDVLKANSEREYEQVAAKNVKKKEKI